MRARLFGVMPLVGGVLAGFAYSALFAHPPEDVPERVRLSREG